MAALGFRLRLTLFVVTTIVAVQALTAVLVTQITRHQLIAEGGRQLTMSANTFVNQLDDISARVAESVQVLALDYALRAAIAQRDRDTVLSVLRNHGRRVGATRMLMIGLDGSIQADTAASGSGLQRFPFPELMDSAFTRRTAAVVALDGKAYWMVVVPIYAPQPVALVAAGIPVDDAFLARMQRLSALPKDIQLIAQTRTAAWEVVARSDSHIDLLGGLSAAGHPLAEQPVLETVDGREYLVLARALGDPRAGAPVQAIIGYSLDDALRPYKSVLSTWLGLLALGLLVGLAGAWLIARGVSRPVEALAASVRRIERGDYSAPALIDREDELGQLAAAFSTMTLAIRQREEHIRFQALHDAVTALPNRSAAEAAIQCSLHEHDSGALLMVGLTRMPEIIKTVGHALGDRLMRDAAERIREATTRGVVARASDTSFLVWLPEADRTAVIALALHLIDVLNPPYQERDVSIDVVPAVGIALYPRHAADTSELLQRAEVAQFAALRVPEAVAFYDAASDPHRPGRLSLMGDLREAIAHDDVALHYQPKLNLRSGVIDSAEALIRWQHPKLGPVPPDAFITLAEETGNIHRVTRWALASAIAQLQRWLAQGLNVRVAVNLSARDLHDPELPRRIADLLTLHQVEARWLELEITESAVIGEPAAAIQVLRELAGLGLHVAVDDFGVGESSLAYLRKLPVHALKIDKMFIQRLATDASDRMIVHSIVELAHRLNHRVVAEGVEDAAALAYLGEVGCDHAQGHHIAAAMPADHFASFVAHFGTAPSAC
ncbi:putative bifunctional diguanylate cyclase/phosphodiesterase [Dyella soli]|uniref:EAL domain-containing protein n=1 Tax=Dyella soli TaxID=522319 RepID=A0A4R0YKC0_9GAMM|nr:EAL domain-containing protein [Dyella soli]TCI08898.1 EAL domain-containing protein [Dyella soli]